MSKWPIVAAWGTGSRRTHIRVLRRCGCGLVAGRAHLIDGRITPLVLLICRRAVLHKPPDHRQLARPRGLKDGRVTVPVLLGDHLWPELLQHRLGLGQVAVCARATELSILGVLFRVVV